MVGRGRRRRRRSSSSSCCLNDHSFFFSVVSFFIPKCDGKDVLIHFSRHKAGSFQSKKAGRGLGGDSPPLANLSRMNFCFSLLYPLILQNFLRYIPLVRLAFAFRRRFIYDYSYFSLFSHRKAFSCGFLLYV